MAKKPLISCPIVVCLAQIWAQKSFFVGFTSTRCYTLSQTIIVSNFKENVWSKLKKIAKNLILDPI